MKTLVASLELVWATANFAVAVLLLTSAFAAKTAINARRTQTWPPRPSSSRLRPMSSEGNAATLRRSATGGPLLYTKA